MSEIIKNRSEILFIYDLRDANPNGDPIDENKPRIDEETGQNIVTDVRLKRTIRDYFISRGLEVFIQEIKDKKGNLKTKEDRLTTFKNNPNEVLKKCIDMRLFGATTAVREKTITWTGPVQFKYGRSLHKVAGPKFFRGTTVMPSREDKKKGTFRDEYILPYSLICFYGIANENAARETLLTEKDMDLLIEGIWNGTKNLITRSKFGQNPRFLLRIVYKGGNFHIGDLDKRISFESEKQDEEIRDIKEGKLDITELLKVLKEFKNRILRVVFSSDDRVLFVQGEIEAVLESVLGGKKVNKLPFE
jgi:CRISPR-associated protein Csh2